MVFIMTEDRLRSGVKNEYDGIFDGWLRLQVMSAAGFVAVTTLIEIVWGLILERMGLVYSTVPQYILKYILAPLAANSVLAAAAYFVLKAKTLKRKLKVYLISLLYALICFVIFTAHSVYYSLFAIFAVPILLTVVYGSYLLTTVTALFSLLLKLFSKRFVSWLPYESFAWTGDIALVNTFVTIAVSLAFYAACLLVIRFERRKNEANLKSELDRRYLQSRLETDELTGVSNRYALEMALEELSKDGKGSRIFVMMDLDNFKQINDGGGHDRGDVFLRDFGRILKRCCGNGVPFRYGGDEFCLLFKDCGIGEAVEACLKIRAELKRLAAVRYPGVPLGASFGIAQYSEGMTVSQLVRKADTALYSAKRVKNEICVMDDKA